MPVGINQVSVLNSVPHAVFERPKLTRSIQPSNQIKLTNVSLVRLKKGMIPILLLHLRTSPLLPQLPLEIP